MSSKQPVLAEVRRGEIVEARHRGAIVAVEPDGHVIAELGDTFSLTSTRSAIKPIQAIPLIRSGAADRFQLSSSELAVSCASHQGEAIHTEAVTAILARVGLDESTLMCGPHAPYSEEVARHLEREGRRFTQLHNNCSGKHAGMLATAVHLGLPTENYVSPDHPVQRAIAAEFARLAGLEGELPTAVDGCSAPTFGVPLRSLAHAFARVVGSADDQACRRVVAAMISHPEMVGGTKGRFDTELLCASHGKLICKVGAEAVYAVGVLPCARYRSGLGIAVKVEDGSYRGMGPAVIEALAQLDVLGKDELSRLASYHKPAIENRRGLIVGKVRPVFKLELN
jgi:L-asparaginase II